MSNVFDVPASDLIEEVAKEFEKNPEIKQPVFALWAKTGSHRERAPQRTDWWYFRLASILYRTYKDGPVGTGRLRTYYGGRKARGVQPHHFRKSGGKVVRLGLQTLERIGLIQKIKKGRVITPKGEELLALKAKETMAGLEAKRKAAKEMAIEREKKRKAQDGQAKTNVGAFISRDKKPESKDKEKEAKKKK